MYIEKILEIRPLLLEQIKFIFSYTTLLFLNNIISNKNYSTAKQCNYTSNVNICYSVYIKSDNFALTL